MDWGVVCAGQEDVCPHIIRAHFPHGLGLLDTAGGKSFVLLRVLLTRLWGAPRVWRSRARWLLRLCCVFWLLLQAGFFVNTSVLCTIRPFRARYFLDDVSRVGPAPSNEHIDLHRTYFTCTGKRYVYENGCKSYSQYRLCHSINDAAG